MTTGKKKPRYSRAKKRELKQVRLEEEEQARKLKRNKRKRKRTTATKGNESLSSEESKATKHKNRKLKDPIDRILHCAEKSLYTDSIVVENREEIISNALETANDENRNQNGNDNTTNNDKLAVEIISGCNLSENSNNGPLSSSSITKAMTTLHHPLHSSGHRLTTCAIKVQPLLVLDLNGILCHRDRLRKRDRFWKDLLTHADTRRNKNSSAKISNAYRDMDRWKLRTPAGKVANTPIVPRTDLLEFLTYLDKHFCLAIWTSAKQKTAKKLLNLLLSGDKGDSSKKQNGIRSRLLFVWSQSHCTAVRSPNSCRKDSRAANRVGTKINNATISSDPETAEFPLSDDNNSKTNDTRKIEINADKADDELSFNDDVVYEKHLSKIWEAYPLWSANNTLLMDDSPEKCPLATANSIHPSPLHGRDPETGNCSKDGDLPVLTDQDNEGRQVKFFRELVNFWTNRSYVSQTSVVMKQQTEFTKTGKECQIAEENAGKGVGRAPQIMANTAYYEFLQSHAKGHMGWRQTMCDHRSNEG